MDVSSIVNLGNAMSAYNTSSSHGMIMAKKAIEQTEIQGDNILKMMESIPEPAVNDGQSLDIKI